MPPEYNSFPKLSIQYFKEKVCCLTKTQLVPGCPVTPHTEKPRGVYTTTPSMSLLRFQSQNNTDNQ